MGPPQQARSNTTTTTITTTTTTVTAMPGQSGFPWDNLKAETLRSIVNDLGIPVARSLRKREGMVNVLTAVTEKGRESVLSNHSLGRTTCLVYLERLLMPNMGSG